MKGIIAVIIIGIVLLAVASVFIFHINDAFAPQTSQQPQAMQPSTGKLISEDITVGTGRAVKSGDTVTVNYTGKLTNGKVFDSSYPRKQPFTTQIGTGQVIKGWDEGIIGMQVGGKRRLTIPPALGYGDQAAGSIPPNSTLIFDVELVGIK